MIRKASCQHAIWLLKRAIEFSKRRGDGTYVCAIDASKAFDKVNRTLLWEKMINKNISAHVILGLINYYKESFMLINSNGEYSTIYKTTFVVKQG